MGCPAKKVCNKWAGSALMQDEPGAVSSSRRWCGLRCARRAGDAEDAHRLVPEREKCGATGACRRGGWRGAVTVHGRTREQGYKGEAEYDTIAAVKAALRVPVVANGDIDSPHKARGAAGHGRRRRHDRPRGAGPALDLSRDRHFLATGELLAPPLVAEVAARCWSTCTTTTACTANSPACARRASTLAGMCANCPAARRSAAA
jgi:tRNA-dihydrouridine synthase B